MLRIFFQRNRSLDKLADKYIVQLNDTLPAVAVAETMLRDKVEGDLIGTVPVEL